MAYLIADQGIVDFLLVTALDEERDAVLRHLPMTRCPPSDADVRIYYRGTLATPGCDYQLALVSLLGMGRVEAATATSDAIRRWQPACVILVGIAGGVAGRNVHLGDILVSEQVVDYELQKKRDSGDEFRWTSHRADPRLLGAAHALARETWVRTLSELRLVAGEPTQHVGPIATGDKVVASDGFLSQLRSYHPGLIGVEMESGGVAAAAFQAADSPGFLMVKAVSDLADADKGAPQVETWRRYAREIAAGYVAALLRSQPIPKRPVPGGGGVPADESSSDGGPGPRARAVKTKWVMVASIALACGIAVALVPAIRGTQDSSPDANQPLPTKIYGDITSARHGTPLGNAELRVLAGGTDVTAGAWSTDVDGFFVVKTRVPVEGRAALSVSLPDCKDPIMLPLTPEFRGKVPSRLDRGVPLEPYFRYSVDCGAPR